MQAITIFTPSGERYFEKGGKIKRGEEETDIEVKKIYEEGDKVVIELSDETLVFKGFKYIVTL